MIKLYEEFIQEEFKEFNIKPPFKMPSGTTSWNGDFKWIKKGGHAGDKIIMNLKNKVKDEKWTLLDSKNSTHVAYDIVSQADNYLSPDKLWKIDFYSKYGETAAYNWYEINLKYLGKKNN